MSDPSRFVQDEQKNDTDHGAALLRVDPSAAVQTEPLPNWQPIGTAPKDADLILLYLDGSGVRPGYWEDLREPGFWCAVESQGLTGGKWYSEPTHWMPLPAPPQLVCAQMPATEHSAEQVSAAQSSLSLPVALRRSHQALQLIESVYRKNVVAPGEPSSVLEAVQAAIAELDALLSQESQP